jgi:hypothetical protein
MGDTRVILVMLRQPRLDDPNEMRTDPLWEFGSFGCTRCHRKNLMNPARLIDLQRARFGFAQNGSHGIKLVHLSPPIRTLHHGSFGEAKWSPAEMPLTYASAPTLVNNLGTSDIPLLLEMLIGVRRGSPVAQFASKFRSRRDPLPPSVAEQVIAVYERWRSDGTGSVARTYVDALPWVPPRVDRNRKATYQQLLQNSAMGGGLPTCSRSAPRPIRPRDGAGTSGCRLAPVRCGGRSRSSP